MALSPLLGACAFPEGFDISLVVFKGHAVVCHGVVIPLIGQLAAMGHDRPVAPQMTQVNLPFSGTVLPIVTTAEWQTGQSYKSV